MAEHLAGARGEGTLVTSDTYMKLHTPASGSPYALGWGVAERAWAGGKVLNHQGSNTMWFATVWLAPERDLGMFAVSNAAGDAGQRGTDAAVVALLTRIEAAMKDGE